MDYTNILYDYLMGPGDLRCDAWFAMRCDVQVVLVVYLQNRHSQESSMREGDDSMGRKNADNILLNHSRLVNIAVGVLMMLGAIGQFIGISM